MTDGGIEPAYLVLVQGVDVKFRQGAAVDGHFIRLATERGARIARIRYVTYLYGVVVLADDPAWPAGIRLCGSGRPTIEVQARRYPIVRCQDVVPLIGIEGLVTGQIKKNKCTGAVPPDLTSP